MITLISKEEQKEILGILSNDIYQNPYLYIDTLTFGFDGNNIKTWKIVDNEIVGIIYQYYDSLQLFVVDQMSDDCYKCLADFIESNGFEMATGSSLVIEKLASYLYSGYTSNHGYIMSFEQKMKKPSGLDIQLCSVNDLHEAAELVCSDDNIGGHYNVETLTQQFISRMQNSGCVNVVYKVDGKIVCHVATYADMKEFAIIGGVITHSNYRGRGIGTAVIQYVVYLLQSQDKLPILYCYEPHLFGSYQRIGFTIKTSCGKLIRKR